MGTVLYTAQNRNISALITDGGFPVYDEVRTAPDFGPFQESLIREYTNLGIRADVSVDQASTLLPDAMLLSGSLAAGNAGQNGFPVPGARSSVYFAVAFQLTEPSAYQFSASMTAPFGVLIVPNNYLVQLSSATDPVFSLASGAAWADVDLTGTNALDGVLPAGNYQLSVQLSVEAGFRMGGGFSYDLSLQVPSPTTIALAMFAWPLAIRRRRRA